MAFQFYCTIFCRHHSPPPYRRPRAAFTHTIADTIHGPAENAWPAYIDRFRLSYFEAMSRCSNEPISPVNTMQRLTQATALPMTHFHFALPPYAP
jgi:hypothetical protein